MGTGLTSSSPPKPGGRRDSGGVRGGINFDLTGTGNQLDELSMGGGAGGMDAFIQGPGASLYETFTLHKTQLKELKQRCRDCSASVNEAKASIDRLQLSLEARKASRIELLRKSGRYPPSLTFLPLSPCFHLFLSTFGLIQTHLLTFVLSHTSVNLCFTHYLYNLCCTQTLLIDRIESIRNRRHC